MSAALLSNSNKVFYVSGRISGELSNGEFSNGEHLLSVNNRFLCYLDSVYSYSVSTS